MKKRKRIVLVTVLLFGFGIIWILWECTLFPYTRRWFINYSTFKNKTAGTLEHYPQELPASAENIKYFYYTGWFDKKTGISFTINKEEYQKFKETSLYSYTADKEKYQEEFQHAKDEYILKKRDNEPEDWEWYMFDGEVTSDFLVEEELDYLNNIFHDAAGDYTVVAYKKVASAGESCYLSGIFCNDSTNEIVLFAFKDTFRKSYHK